MNDLPFALPDRPVHTVFWHCTASPHAHHRMETIRKWHTDPRDEGGRGWSDVGYHGLFCLDSSFELGRPVERIPAAQGGHNTGTLAFALQGLRPSDFTAGQLEEVADFALMLTEAYAARGITLRHRGHIEVAAKACPVFDYKAVLNLSDQGYMIGKPRPDLSNNLPEHDTAEGARRAWVVLDLWDRGKNVRTLQSALNEHGADLVVDGIFGQNTRAAVIDFQRSAGLMIDGIVGPNTRAALWPRKQK